MKNIFFYMMTVLIWGSTWIAIKFQVGAADPMVSIAYRFILASIILIIWCVIFRVNLKFSITQYLRICLQGVFLFAFNYLCIYSSEIYLTSGVSAVIFSTIVIMNIINSYFFLGTKLNKRIILGAITGLFGIGLVFQSEISSFSTDRSGLLGLFLAFLGTMLASFGNIISARNQKDQIPIVQTNAIGMGAGGIIMLILALASGRDMTIVSTMPYLSSLLYLSLFGSIFAFGCYLSLVGNIGPEKAAYATLVFPLVALLISTVWEGYTWSVSAYLGVMLILAGNILVIQKKGQAKRPDENRDGLEKRDCDGPAWEKS